MKNLALNKEFWTLMNYLQLKNIFENNFILKQKKMFRLFLMKS